MQKTNRSQKHLLPLSVLFCVILAPFVFAQGEADADTSSTRQDPSGKSSQNKMEGTEVVEKIEFSWALGAGVVISPRPYTGANSRVMPIPSLDLQYKGWFFQGIRGGYSFVKSDRFNVNLFAQAQLRGLNPEDSPYLEGMEKRSRSMDAGLEFIYNGRPVGFRGGFLTDILGRSKGQELSLLVMTGAPLGGRGVILFGIGPRWVSQNRVDYYYGVRSGEATASRPAYTAPSTWNLDINVTGIVNLSSKWRIFALMNRGGFGSGIKDSPIVDRTSGYSFISSLSYRFK